MKKIFLILTIVFPNLIFALDLSMGRNAICIDSSGLDIGTTLCTVINKIGDIAVDVIILLMIVATVVFIWGIVRYIIAGNSEQRKKEGRSMIIWGLAGLFILVAMWGLIFIIENTFGIKKEHIPTLPGQINF